MIFGEARLILWAVILTATLSFGGMAVVKYKSMEKSVESLTKENAELIASVEAKQNTIHSLEYAIDQTNIKMDELVARNSLLEEDVQESKAKINKIRKERDMALDNLGKVPVPEGCEDKFKWLIDRAQEISK